MEKGFKNRGYCRTGNSKGLSYKATSGGEAIAGKESVSGVARAA